MTGFDVPKFSYFPRVLLKECMAIERESMYFTSSCLFAYPIVHFPIHYFCALSLSSTIHLGSQEPSLCTCQVWKPRCDVQKCLIPLWLLTPGLNTGPSNLTCNRPGGKVESLHAQIHIPRLDVFSFLSLLDDKNCFCGKDVTISTFTIWYSRLSNSRSLMTSAPPRGLGLFLFGAFTIMSFISSVSPCQSKSHSRNVRFRNPES